MSDPLLLMYAVYDSEDERFYLDRLLEEGNRAGYHWDVPPIDLASRTPESTKGDTDG